MNEVVILFAAGILLLAVEILFPGGFVAALAGICFALGVAVSFFHFGSTIAVIAAASALLLGGVTVYLELFVLPKTRFARKIFANTTLLAKSQPDLAHRDEILGREAVAVTPLAPTGLVEIAGRRYEAYSRHGHVAPGAALRIVDMDTFRLIVTPTKENS